MMNRQQQYAQMSKLAKMEYSQLLKALQSIAWVAIRCRQQDLKVSMLSSGKQHPHCPLLPLPLRSALSNS